MQYGIVKRSHHVVNYIPRTYLFYNWKFVAFDLFRLNHHLPTVSGNQQSVLCISEFAFSSPNIVLHVIQQSHFWACIWEKMKGLI